MDRFPQMLFCFPAAAIAGALAEPLQDGTYGIRTVASEEEHAAALAQGWHESTADARAAHADQIAAALAATAGSVNTGADDQVDETSPPTRAELEAKATELEIKFTAKTSDKKLADQIAAALEP